MHKGYARPTAKARELRNNATDAERALWQALRASCAKVGTGFAPKTMRKQKLGRAACVQFNAARSSARKVAGVRFNRQVPVGPFICDFMARSIGLIIEVDGGQHGVGEDAARTRFLSAQGYRVIRFWNNDVLGNLDGVVTEIERVIAWMGSDMPSPSPAPSRLREGSFKGRAV